MHPEDFIHAVKQVVHDSSVRGVRETLEHPSGRKPQKSVIELSQWYHSLSESDRQRVMQAVQHAVHGSIFGFLCVLDGVCAVESTPDKGHFELYHVRGDQKTLLTDSSGEMLHDIYQSEVYEEVFRQRG